MRHGDGLVVGTRSATGLRVRRFGPGDALDPAFGEEGVAAVPGESVRGDRGPARRRRGQASARRRLAGRDLRGGGTAPGRAATRCCASMPKGGPTPRSATKAASRARSSARGAARDHRCRDIAVAADGDPVLAYSEYLGRRRSHVRGPGRPDVDAHMTRLDAQTGYGVDPAFGDHDLGIGWVAVSRDLDVTPDGGLLLGGLATDARDASAGGPGSPAATGRPAPRTRASEPRTAAGGCRSRSSTRRPPPSSRRPTAASSPPRTWATGRCSP